MAAKKAATKIERGFDLDLAIAHLKKYDKPLASWIKKIGPLETTWSTPFDPLDRLARAILYQQLSGKAAETIMGRLLIALDGGKKFKAEQILQLSEIKARACGVSGNKWLALTDLAHKAFEGVVPSAKAMENIADDELIERLTSVRGIGRWTVEMLLIFPLGRPDILPVDDLGVRRGAQILHGHHEMMKPKQLAEHGEIWAPYRSVAARYLWRISDFEKTVQANPSSKKYPKTAAKKITKKVSAKSITNSKTKLAAKKAKIKKPVTRSQG